MAIISEIVYTGNGSQKNFTVTGNILSESHVGVWINDGTTEERLSTADYSILGSVVLLNTAPLNGVSIKLLLSDNGEDLSTPPSDLSEINAISGYIKLLGDNIDEILRVDENTGLSKQYKDNALSYANSIKNMNAVTINSSLPASWDSSTNTLSIPQGQAGVAGEDGRTPQYEFVYNEVTGNIEYNLIGYTDESEPSVGVWN